MENRYEVHIFNGNAWINDCQECEKYPAFDYSIERLTNASQEELGKICDEIMRVYREFTFLS